MKNIFRELLQTKFPIIQGGMVWCSGWKLASAVSNNGGLGVIGAGSMTPQVLEEHILKLKANCNFPFAVNLPLMYAQIADHVEVVLKHKVPVVITSAGNPMQFTAQLQAQNCKVLHVVASSKFAQKAINAGVNGLIAEGFEAGGHNGKDETTTLCLIPSIRKLTELPLIAAGGIASGKSIFAAIALGADGVQIGSRFAISKESSAHELFKKAVIAAREGDTLLTLKELTPVRLLKSPFFSEVMQAYQNKASTDELRTLLGKGRAKKGIFKGNLSEGELEIGQVAAQLTKIESVKDIIQDLVDDFNLCSKQLQGIQL